MPNLSPINIDFTTLERIAWIKTISDNVTILSADGKGIVVTLGFDNPT